MKTYCASLSLAVCSLVGLTLPVRAGREDRYLIEAAQHFAGASQQLCRSLDGYAAALPEDLADDFRDELEELREDAQEVAEELSRGEGRDEVKGEMRSLRKSLDFIEQTAQRVRLDRRAWQQLAATSGALRTLEAHYYGRVQAPPAPVPPYSGPYSGDPFYRDSRGWEGPYPPRPPHEAPYREPRRRFRF